MNKVNRDVQITRVLKSLVYNECGLFFKMDFPRSKRNKLEYLRILKFLKILLNSFQVKIINFKW